eukprot:gnl/TRDRNA2_/TRDRNA2_170777_c1_seq4.p1 gnl/TRDRNA2_/TRDRNA2_170777_c1~~gnl/TRDRNA2_/TRDRNA2_170777_c1_seq4.p1  ORF type:complete len:784 (+),score=92.70 gnl/TRDRNA2_/TRDRNA2_170777_c1_seq4:206-2353(+)
MRTDLDPSLKFEIDFVWDIFRHVEDVLVVRIMRAAPSTSGSAQSAARVLSYWTYSKFCERLAMMRSCHNTLVLRGSWDPTSHVFEDPWSEPALIELRQRLQLEGLAAGRQQSIAATPVAPSTSRMPMPALASVTAAKAAMTGLHERPTSASRARSSSKPSAAPRRAQPQGGLPRANTPALDRRGAQTPTSSSTTCIAQSAPSGRGNAGADGAGGPPSPSFVAMGEGDEALARATWTARLLADGSQSPDGRRPPLEASPAKAAVREAATDIKVLEAERIADRWKGQCQRQTAELRRLKSEMEQSDELVASLRSQLAEKDQLVEALRLVMRDQVAGDLKKSQAPQSDLTSGESTAGASASEPIRIRSAESTRPSPDSMQTRSPSRPQSPRLSPDSIDARAPTTVESAATASPWSSRSFPGVEAAPRVEEQSPTPVLALSGSTTPHPSTSPVAVDWRPASGAPTTPSVRQLGAPVSRSHTPTASIRSAARGLGSAVTLGAVISTAVIAKDTSPLPARRPNSPDGTRESSSIPAHPSVQSPRIPPTAAFSPLSRRNDSNPTLGWRTPSGPSPGPPLSGDHPRPRAHSAADGRNAGVTSPRTPRTAALPSRSEVASLWPSTRDEWNSQTILAGCVSAVSSAGASCGAPHATSTVRASSLSPQAMHPTALANRPPALAVPVTSRRPVGSPVVSGTIGWSPSPAGSPLPPTLISKMAAQRKA